MARSDSDRCRDLEALLSLHASEDLEPEEARRVEAHIEGCPRCRREVEAWRRQADRLGALRRKAEEAPLSPLFWKAIRKGIGEEPIPLERLRRRRSRPAWIGAAAALVLGAGISMVAFTLLMERNTGPGTPAATSTAGKVQPAEGDASEPPLFPPIEPQRLPPDWMGAVPDKIPL
ncbi:MAG: zf-HC2 domain-containing protein [Planctomycetes bacterium]|nr:zf-HC2 domain-containing protein [Planctomycetota bacterium]